MKGKTTLLICLWLGCFAPSLLFGQDIPPIQIFSPKDTQTGNQNWMIDQANDGSVFFANNQGAVNYNGAEWRLLPAQDNSIVRSVKIIDDRVYTSSYMDFGYWEKDETGSFEYTSLSENFNIDVLEDEQFWNIIPFGEKIIFQSLSRLLIIHPTNGKLQAFSYQNTVVKSCKIDNEVYFQVLNKGLYKITQEQEVKLVSNDVLFQKTTLVNLVKHGQGINIVTQDNGFFHYSANEGLSPWGVQNNLLKKDYVIYSAIQMKNGGYAIGTIGKGLILLSKQGAIVQKITQENGLSNNTVLSIHEDKKNNLWLGLDNGINLINNASAIKEYSDVNGQLGSIYTSTTKDGYLYLGTNQGLFVKSEKGDDDFELIENTQGQVWTLAKIGDDLFCGHDRGAFLVQGGKAALISSTRGVWRFKQYPGDPTIIFFGNYTGINTLVKEKGQWRNKNKLTGFTISSRFFEFISPKKLIVNHEYKGVFLLELDELLKSVTASKLEKSSCKSCNSSLVKRNNDLFYKAKDQFLVFDSDQEEFIPSDLLEKIDASSDFINGKLIDDNEGQWWILTKNTIYALVQEDKEGVVNVHSFGLNEGDRKNVSGFENINKIGEQSYLIGSSKGYLTVDLNEIEKEVSKVNIFAIEANNKVKQSRLDLKKPITLDSDYNNLGFHFTNFDYNRYGKTLYQYRLDGEDVKWSEWSENTTAFYSNLAPGMYEFNVRSKNENTISKPIISSPITIAPPWYLNRIAISCYAIVLLVLLFFYNAYYQRKLTKQRIALKEENKRLLEIQELETQKEIIRLRNEQLKKDIDGKSRELAVATMSTLKRNEFLNKIKKELSEIKDVDSIKKIIKNINAKLKNNDDWEYFKKAFDNTDQGLFRKLKSEHPALTKNDLKLCAYLRLNLSSKEIAPLLNISVHSVEIKRYRLRKKMNLKRNQGIVEYIMTF